MNWLVALLILVALPGCGAPPIAPRNGEGGSGGSLVSSSFSITYTSSEAASIANISASAESAVPRVVSELGASGMPQVRVTYYPTQTALADAVRPIVGPIPTWATGLVTSSRDIHLLSAQPGTPDAVAREATRLMHEFAHCVTLHRNPNAANNPRWLWETLAIYAARDVPGRARVEAVLGGPRPTYAQLNGFDSPLIPLIYDVGYTIGEFIVQQAGLDGLRALLMSGGDTRAGLGLDPEAFLDAWFAWARSH